MPTSPPPPRWRVLVPLKVRTQAKTRLGPVGPGAREALALAMALDVVSAALDCAAVAAVTVVTDDEQAARRVRLLGAEVFAGAPPGLNPALVAAAGHVSRRWPADGVAALCADLPCLLPADLEAALRAVPTGRRALVPDADGTGTTLLAAAAGVALSPGYGPGSCARHLADGAVLLHAAPGLRLDADTPQDLVRALALGVGPHTRDASGHVRAS